MFSRREIGRQSLRISTFRNSSLIGKSLSADRLCHICVRTVSRARSKLPFFFIIFLTYSRPPTIMGFHLVIGLTRTYRKGGGKKNRFAEMTGSRQFTVKARGNRLCT